MKLLSLFIALSIQAMANPTPVLDCEYQDEDITAKVQVMDSSSPGDEFSKFQTYYQYKNNEDHLFISELVRYDDMYNHFDEAGKYIFSSQYMAMSIEIDTKTMTAKMAGPLCNHPSFINLCLSNPARTDLDCSEVCLSQVEYEVLDCKAHADLDKLKFHPWSDY
jgi:hypothetical protein